MGKDYNELLIIPVILPGVCKSREATTPRNQTAFCCVLTTERQIMTLPTSQTNLQKILVSLSETEIAVDPGSVAQVVVTMTNRQENPDRLMIEVEGVDVEWYSIPVSAANLGAGAQSGERIIFRVARGAGNRAGAYPFIVRVQAMETGETGVAQATLIVNPFNSLQMELNPKRGSATFLRPLNDFEISLTNESNEEKTFDLFASDQDNECAYEFDTERVTMKPGQTLTIPLATRPKTSAFFGGMRLYSFTVSARAVDNPYVAANAHGQLERHALISPGVGIFLCLLAIGAPIAYSLRPKPPIPLFINKFVGVPDKVNSGDDITLSWDVAPGYQQLIMMKQVGKQDAVALNEQPKPEQNVGSLTTRPEPLQTTYYLVVRGQNGQKDLEKKVVVSVAPPPAAKVASLKYFRINPAVVHQGESVMLSWQASEADKFILDPGNVTLNGAEQTRQIVPDHDEQYTLRSFGKDGKPGNLKTVSVRVVGKDICIAEIVSFRAANTVYEGDKVRLTWKTRYARTVRIDSDQGAVGDVGNPLAGSVTIDTPINTPITFTLTATDSAGKFVTKTYTVKPEVRPIPVEPKPIPPVDGTTVPPTGEGTTVPPTTGGTTSPP